MKAGTLKRLAMLSDVIGPEPWGARLLGQEFRRLLEERRRLLEALRAMCDTFRAAKDLPMAYEERAVYDEGEKAIAYAEAEEDTP